MAKKLLKDYFFQPGIPLSGNRKPNAWYLLSQNLEFIKDEIVAYVDQQVTGAVAPFIGYSQTDAVIEADIEAVVNAIINDVRYSGNAATRTQASTYWVGNTAQISGDRLPEVAYLNFTRDLINNYILTNSAYSSLQSPVVTTQTINGSYVTEPSVTTTVTTLFGNITNTITNGLTSLPDNSPNLISSIETIGKLDLENLTLVTNVTDNIILYSFADPNLGGSVTFSAANSTNYTNATTIDNGTSILYLNKDTDTMSASDDLQIFLDTKETIIRPYDFGVDAVERMRVAAPQAMLDADFEYGLQPTKWQQISAQRGYPSTYEVPGSELTVTSVTTDASVGTSGIGSSLITVTTQGAHGFSAGQAITVKALDQTVQGFSRAEGSFIIETVPTTSTLTYYAKARVGTSNGQALTTSTVILRKADFYTGANVGNPTITVSSNGSSGSFTTVLDAPSGSNIVTFSGAVPPTNAPIDSALTTSSTTFATTGTAITASFGSGGSIGSFRVANDVSTFATSITLTDDTNILQNMAIDDGNGEQLIITNVNSNVISLNSGVQTTFNGDIQIYDDLSPTEIIGTGSSATFDISKAGGTYTVDAVNAAGSGYNVGDTLRIAGADLGGVTGDTETYSSVTTSGVVGTGTSATFDITVSAGSYGTSGDPVTVNTAGSGYEKGDAILISGTNLGGSSPANDLEVYVVDVDSIGGITSATFVSGTGTGTGTFTNVGGTNIAPLGFGFDCDVTRTNGTYSITINSAGQDFLANNRLKVLGTALDGASPANDLIIKVITTDSINGIATVELTGTAVTGNDLDLTVLSIDSATGVLTVTIKDGANDASTGTTTYTGVNHSNVSGSPTGLIIHVTRNGGTYSNAIVSGGSNHVVGQRFKILGTALEGSTTTNDATFTVSSIDSAGAVTGLSSSGTAIRGATINVYSTVSLGDNTIAASDTGSTVSYSSIAELECSFTTPHGFVPGDAVTIVIKSNDGVNNHELAGGPYFVEQVPTSTTFRYTARAAGNILTLSNDSSSTAADIQAEVYIRPDAFYVHRPFDGGVQLGTGGPAHGAAAIRQSKKYIRYQSGKGATYNTGILFAPNFDIRSVTSSGTTIGSTITIETDEVDHGLQASSDIKLNGVSTPGYDGTYTVSTVVNERKITVIATQSLGGTTGELSSQCTISLFRWSGAVVRAGAYDDQNGIFFQYDGQYVGVGRRTSTFQISGVAAINANENTVTGTNTRFLDQLQAGDRVVIRGMTHVVSAIDSQTTMYVTPDFRGVSNVSGVKIAKVQDLIIPSNEWNLDKCDGTGPSGYVLDPTKMQMIGISYSWYGAGFIDWTIRGPNGNWVYVHRLKGNNLNYEAYMRTGNAPVRYEVLNEGARSKLDGSITDADVTMTLDDVSDFPNTGTVYVDNEIINYSGRNTTANTLTGLSRAASLQNFAAGSIRTYTAGNASAHSDAKGVVLISNTSSPIISHWGSAYLIDGRFDEDRGYIFNYTSTGLTASTTKQTAFLIRLAPSVSNAIVGDLGERDLLNRAQLLLKSLEITSLGTNAGTLVVEGVINPQNYPLDPGDISWSGLQGLAQGGQPSFAQIAPGGSVNWSGGSTLTTNTATTQTTMSTTAITAYTTRNSTSLYLTEASFEGKGIRVGSVVSGASYPANTLVQQIIDYGSYYYVRTSKSHNGYLFSGRTITFQYGGNAAAGSSTLNFTEASWESLGASVSTLVADTDFPANTRVTSINELTFGATNYYEVSFSQSSTGAVNAGDTVTFQFGSPAVALPGETIFSFIANAGERASIDLGELKELTTTTLGGRGAFPNGPDVLAINVYKVSGSDTTCDLTLNWGEAQA
jgi:hypothetical protein